MPNWSSGGAPRAMSRDVDEMQHMLDAFLDFAKGDAAEDEAVPTDPVELARSVVLDAARGGHKVRLASVSGSGTALMRPVAVRRALSNLIGNATRHGTKAEVSVALLDKSVRFTVEDDGPGIPRSQRDEALRPFTRLDTARNQDMGSGVGLGLAITADIARSHGGTLRLSESQTLGGLRADLVIAR